MALTPVTDHAERALALIPSQHDRASWRKLARAMLGARGTWADDADGNLWAVRTADNGTLVFRRDALAYWFGAGSEGEGVITEAASSTYDLGDGRVLNVSSNVGTNPAQSTETLQAAIAAGEVLAVYA